MNDMPAPEGSSGDLTGTNSSSCDREEIHLAGAIQPHGVLIALDLETMRHVHVSKNAPGVLGLSAEALLGQPLNALLTDEDCQKITATGTTTGVSKVLSPVTVTSPRGDKLLECIPHKHAGHLILEFFEPSENESEDWQEDVLRRQVISELVRPETLPDLAQLSARLMRQVNGFDRVMIYRFSEDNHGQVIAENTEKAESYLGLHYPASDIPEPARRHFRLNVIRVIADVEAKAVDVVTTAGPQETDTRLDLSYSVLRAVPETHLEYLRNMGVAASMSVSLVTNDRLWGLIACHHDTPRRVSTDVLRFAELLAGTISALLQGIENREQLSRAIEAERVAFAMEKQGRSGTLLKDVVVQWAPDLMRLLDAQGLVFRQWDTLREFGIVPTPSLNYSPLREDLAEGVAASGDLRTQMNLDTEQVEVAAGAGYMELSGDGEDYLVLLRREHEHVVSWAGKPETVAEQLADGSTRLNPRKSFALWREERRGISKPFDETDLEALRIIRRALFALNSLEREQKAVEARREAEAEEERLRLVLLDAARKTSMGELASALAHELNQPLAAVTNYINACRAQLTGFDVSVPDGFDALMLDAVSEASRAADLVRRLRDFIAGGALSLEETHLEHAIRQGVDLAMVAHGSDRPDLAVDIPSDLPKLWIDPIQIGQVVLNLAMNAITAMRDRDRRELRIKAQLDDRFVEVLVEDTGPGIPPDGRAYLFEPFHSTTTSGMGIGLSLCRSIVEAHGGRIWAPQTSDCGQIAFTLPVEGGGRD